MKTNILITSIMVLLISTMSCESNNPGPNYGGGGGNSNNTGGEWLIPLSEVRDGGPGKDGIPALLSPIKWSVNDPANDYLRESQLVLGYQHEGEICAYPHPILDWHEIINNTVGGQPIAVTYCPLTGTGIGWERIVQGRETTFGVSGLLYNSNLIPYDRNTGSNWSQIRMDCVNGLLIGQEAVVLPLIEMPWGTWKKLFPESKVVSTITGHTRSYGSYPYGSYRTNSSLIFPAQPSDDRLHPKERVLAVIREDLAKVYRFEHFGSGPTVIQDEFMNMHLALVGTSSDYMVALNAEVESGVVLQLRPGETEGILLDEEGNEWNLFGVAVSGPRKAQQLKPVKAMMAYWFSIAAFYPKPEIYSAG
jgi:hypothetical protein